MRLTAVIIVVFVLWGCGGPAMYDSIVFSPKVDPASVRDAARYARDQSDCKGFSRTFGASMAYEARVYANCLRGRGYSVIGL